MVSKVYDFKDKLKTESIQAGGPVDNPQDPFDLLNPD